MSKSSQLKADASDHANVFLPNLKSIVAQFVNDDSIKFPDSLYEEILRFISSKKTPVKIEFFTAKDLLNDEDITVLQILLQDSPFIIETIKSLLLSKQLPIELDVHPILSLERDKEGNLTKLGKGADHFESFSRIHLPELTPEQMNQIEKELFSNLNDLSIILRDHAAIEQTLDETIQHLDFSNNPAEDITEAKEFLTWLKNENFTFMGTRYYTIKDSQIHIHDNALGILENQETQVFPDIDNLEKLPANVQKFLLKPKLITINKSDLISPIRRRLPLDVVNVSFFDENGVHQSDRMFVGLFSLRVYMNPARQIPLVRRKIDYVTEKTGFNKPGYRDRAIRRILDNIHRDELFQISPDDLYKMALGIYQIEEKPRPALFLRKDPLERFVSCFFYCPPSLYSTSLRVKVLETLEKTLNGHATSYQTSFADTGLTCFSCVIRTQRGKIPHYDVETLEQELSDIAKTWEYRFQESLIATFGKKHGLELLQKNQLLFPASFQESFSQEEAIAALAHAYKVIESREISLEMTRRDDQTYRLTFFGCGAEPILSELLSTLDNMRMNLLSVTPHRLKAGSDDVWVFDLTVHLATPLPVTLEEAKVLLRDAMSLILEDKITNDEFNSLILATGLNWRQARILRAYYKYLRQIGISHSLRYIRDTLCNYGEITRAFIALFEARFDPEYQDRNHQLENITKDIHRLLKTVKNLDEDRILRRFLNAITATLRTNIYQNKSYFSFKFDCEKLEEMPLPRPKYEIFVYSSEVEGIHLRGGKVARGGIRWSDRVEDFRTEVLGLVKAQMVKNAVIVPVGSKGGFVIKKAKNYASKDEQLAHGIECYKTLVRGLLDLTDNYDAKGQIIHPPHVVRYDDNDPYLVVAADKGTATFSDIANGLSEEYGFWLGDAFASGGSKGYDHKKMAITAKGGWESVKRHFREIDIDCQLQDFTCVGVGDMAGDVFGNAMLLSEHTKLLGAFNHMHIFLDPNPDTKKSFAERQRLFDLPKSSWADYDAKLISKGGGVFERSLKSIPLSPEVQAMFGITDKELSPNDLMRLLLKAEVDLLWFGGIGTYVKSHDETHVQVGDKANDSLRINGEELRAKIIGEGANLGMTQLGRVEFAMHGGRLNTDFIDNCGGVSCSDHEVNIKIFMNRLVRDGLMTLEKRDEILLAMTSQVADLVLQDNYDQSQSLSLALAEGDKNFDKNVDHMRYLEKIGLLQREIEYLPNDQQLKTRFSSKMSFMRPELCTLLSYTKMATYNAVLASKVPDFAALEKEFMNYFPTTLQNTQTEQLKKHPLRREIIATVFANEMVNRLQLHSISSLLRQPEATIENIGEAYMASRDILGIHELWQQVSALDNQIPAKVQTMLLLKLRRALKLMMRWFLKNPVLLKDAHKNIPPKLESLKKALADLIKEGHLDPNVTDEDFSVVPAKILSAVTSLDHLEILLDVLSIPSAEKNPKDALKVFMEIGEDLSFNWVLEQANKMVVEDVWQQRALDAQVSDIKKDHVIICEEALHHPQGLAGWQKDKEAMLNLWQQTMLDIRAERGFDLSQTTVFLKLCQTISAKN